MRSKLTTFRFPLLLVAFAATVLACRVMFCARLQPEIMFYTQFAKNKFAWSRKMSAEHGKKVVVIGGSSVAFSVMGTRMLEQHGLATVNMGLEAPLGATLLTRCALDELHRGDTLIISIEPSRLVCNFELFSSGCKLANELGHPEWVYMPWDRPRFPWLGSVLGGNIGWRQLVFTWNTYFQTKSRWPFIKKKTTPWPYSIAKTDASGWQTTSRRLPIRELPPNYCGHLSADYRKLLQWTREWCDRNGVRVAYSLPWAYRETENAAALQAAHRVFLKEINEVVPVLKDVHLGAYGERGHFLDTEYHLDEKGAAARTDELAREIKAWDVWQPGELDALQFPETR